MRLKLLFFLISIFSFNKPGNGQAEYPKDYFRSPVDIPIYLAGNFAELRPNHFHAGIDIKTEGVEGKNIYAIADGHISRINISPYGYGYALYVDHPNGYTSVYAHLKSFKTEIAEYVKSKQYEKQKWAITLYPENGKFIVKKGEVIGLSGNTGSSSAPHLHFEIRETKTEFPVNPLLFGFNIKDNIPPIVYGLKFYPQNNESTFENSFTPVVRGVKSGGKNYILKDTSIIANGKVGIAINTVDKLNGSVNRCGIYSIELYVNEEIKISQNFTKLNFATNRYINGYKDYQEYKVRKSNYHRVFKVKNNDLDIYDTVLNSGILTLEEDSVYNVFIVVKDVYGNSTSVEFKIKGGKNLSRKDANDYDAFLDCLEENTIEKEDLTIIFPPKTMYEDLRFKYSRKPKYISTFAPIHILDRIKTPVQKQFTIKLKTEGIPEEKADKAVVIQIKNKVITGKGGIYENGWITTKIKSFGTYSVMLDEKAPVVTPTDFTNNKNVSKYRNLNFKVVDDISGVKSVEAHINNEWIPLIYTPKKNKYTYVFDNNRVPKGNLELKIRAIDDRGNVTEKSYLLVR